MVGRVDRELPSRHLPPPEAWKQPDKWMNLTTGRIRPDIEKIRLETDDRGFLLPQQVIPQLNEVLFWDDYDWKYDPKDVQTRPDDHHMHYERRKYLPSAWDNDDTPRRFRELPTMIARVPRQYHNALHETTLAPAMPDYDAMKQHVDASHVAMRLFRGLYKSAERALYMSHQFGALDALEAVDRQTREDLLRSSFAKNFSNYSRLVGEFKEYPDWSIIDERLNTAPVHKPNYVVKNLGVIARRSSIDMLPLITSRAA